jgi:glycosyltransferase involved in cell wall biosynthesis
MERWRRRMARLGDVLTGADPGGRVVLRTFLDDRSGFGRFALNVGRAIRLAGTPVAIDRIGEATEWMDGAEVLDVPPIADAAEDPWRLQVHFLGEPVLPKKATVYVTMHETTRLPDYAVEVLNQCVGVIVPSRWNAEEFARGGVRSPIRVVRAGLDTAAGFWPAAVEPEGPFTVLFAGRLNMGGMRKGAQEALDAFQEAFRGVRNVRLVYKLWGDVLDAWRPPRSDPRVTYDARPLTTRALGDWYRRGHVYLAPTKSEGIGLHTLEAMACGLPPIIPLATGTADYVPPEVAYPLAYDWRPAAGYYAGQGVWARPLPRSIVAALREAYEDVEGRRRRSWLAARHARSLTWEASGRAYREALEGFGMLRLSSVLDSPDYAGRAAGAG